MLLNRLYRRTARLLKSRGGFTLVELLVVIGIIAILAGVALGPITNGINKAKQSAAVQESHALGLAMYSAANDNQQVYPDSTSGQASDVAKALLAGGYVTDPSIFYISGGATIKYSGTAASALSAINSSNISWDFAGASGSGLSSTQCQFLPLLWTAVSTGGTEVNLSAAEAAGGTIVYAVPASTSVFKQNGMAAFFINNSAAYVTQNLSQQCVLVTAANNQGGLPATPTPKVNAGQ
jgi:prepilin-type N-terminal cleavage/methylation domain-containing protein